MASAKKVNKATDELDLILGNKNGVAVDDFIDGNSRVLTPITLVDFAKFMDYIQIINVDALWTNFLTPDSSEAITEILKISFKNQDIDSVKENINSANFDLIFNKIMKVNGINLKGDEGTTDDGKK